jgi:NAD(P)H-hydrate epimerase
MRDIDRAAIEQFGIPRLVLMEHAGAAIAKTAAGMLTGRRSKRVAIFVGRGHNGGDGCVAARHLVNRGATAIVYLVGAGDGLTEEAGVNLEIVRRLGVPVVPVAVEADLQAVPAQLADAALIVDALLGIGLTGLVRPPAAQAIEVMNTANKPVLAVDVPSGLDATTGQVLGGCVRATQTVTFGLLKRGLTIGEGPAAAGKVTVADIGLPRQLLRR